MKGGLQLVGGRQTSGESAWRLQGQVAAIFWLGEWAERARILGALPPDHCLNSIRRISGAHSALPACVQFPCPHLPPTSPLPSLQWPVLQAPTPSSSAATSTKPAPSSPPIARDSATPSPASSSSASRSLLISSHRCGFSRHLGLVFD